MANWIFTLLFVTLFTSIGHTEEYLYITSGVRLLVPNPEAARANGPNRYYNVRILGGDITPLLVKKLKSGQSTASGVVLNGVGRTKKVYRMGSMSTCSNSSCRAHLDNVELARARFLREGQVDMTVAICVANGDDAANHAAGKIMMSTDMTAEANSAPGGMSDEQLKANFISIFGHPPNLSAYTTKTTQCQELTTQDLKISKVYGLADGIYVGFFRNGALPDNLSAKTCLSGNTVYKFENGVCKTEEPYTDHAYAIIAIDSAERSPERHADFRKKLNQAIADPIVSHVAQCASWLELKTLLERELKENSISKVEFNIQNDQLDLYRLLANAKRITEYRPELSEVHISSVLTSLRSAYQVFVSIYNGTNSPLFAAEKTNLARLNQWLTENQQRIAARLSTNVGKHSAPPTPSAANCPTNDTAVTPNATATNVELPFCSGNYTTAPMRVPLSTSISH